MKKEHIEVLLKIYLNRGKRTTASLLDKEELDKIVPILEEKGYITRVERHYHEVTRLFVVVFQNFIDTVSILA